MHLALHKNCPQDKELYYIHIRIAVEKCHNIVQGEIEDWLTSGKPA